MFNIVQVLTQTLVKEILKQFKQFKQYNLKFRNLNVQSKTQKPTDEFIYQIF